MRNLKKLQTISAKFTSIYFNNTFPEYRLLQIKILTAPESLSLTVSTVRDVLSYGTAELHKYTRNKLLNIKIANSQLFKFSVDRVRQEAFTYQLVKFQPVN